MTMCTPDGKEPAYAANALCLRSKCAVLQAFQNAFHDDAAATIFARFLWRMAQLLANLPGDITPVSSIATF